MEVPRKRPGLKVFLGGIALGVILLAGAAGAMRMTDQRPFCGSCHIMQEAALTHKISTHANIACNECHAPFNLAAKIPFKAQEGIRDFVGNMAGNDVPIPTSIRTKDVVNDNCKRCHTMTNKNVASMDAKPYCIDCHRSNAHMRQKPISTRTVAYE